jgi:carbonic anhydrase
VNRRRSDRRAVKADILEPSLMAQGTFVTAINCMDGRVQEPVLQWMKKRLQADHVDMITEPGPDRIMTEGSPDALESIKNRVNVSVNTHGSRVVAVVVHHDCAGFPVSKEEHLAATAKCADIIDSWLFPVRVLRLWVNENWQVELIDDSLEKAGQPSQTPAHAPAARTRHPAPDEPDSADSRRPPSA